MQALILAGGSGTRFWPLSRQRRPKQFLALGRGKSLLQRTVERIAPLVDSESIWICARRGLRDAIHQELPGIPPSQILLEPTGHNTAAAIGWSISSMPPVAQEQVVVVLPSDHWVAEPDAFRHSLRNAVAAVEEGDHVVALGVEPRWPETGYGYLEVGEVIDAGAGLRRVVRFTEKPDAETAQRFFDGGRHLWNAGIFLFRGRILLSLLERFQPEISAGLATIAQDPGQIDEIYSRLPQESIDTGVMEHLETLLTQSLDCGWSDLGSWEALMEVLPADESGNRIEGDVVAIGSRDNLLYADSGTVAVVGVEGLVVVRTGDSVLVVPRVRSQEVRRLVAELERWNRRELL